MRHGIHVENLAMTCTMGRYTTKRRRGCGWDTNRFEQDLNKNHTHMNRFAL